MRRLAVVLAVPTVVLALPALAVQAAPAPEAGQRAAARQLEVALGSDQGPNPRAEKQAAMRERAHELVLKGKRVPRGKNQVVKVGRDAYVELAREKEDTIFTVLGEFGDAEIAHEHGSHGGGSGPVHNEIPEPDRDLDNFTIWFPDFTPAHYEELLFDDSPGANSMRNYYIEQSSGRYAVNGDVTDWVQVPGNAASYGSNYCGYILCDDTWAFVDDSVDAWVDASGMDAGELQEYLADFDVWDRYDHDLDGDFDEPDGYLDHFQAVHAGVGEESCVEGCEELIWSHRSYAHYLADGPDGPGPEQAPFGGVEIGDTGFWVGDYTVEPENGGLGVFAHEFGHDLGLPDLYDTSVNTGGASNSTGFWTLMSFGSYASTGIPEEGGGSKPTHMGNFEKLLLGWLDYELVQPGETRKMRLGPAEHTSADAQGAVLLLPDNVVGLELGPPHSGEHYYWSGSGNLLDNTMTRTTTVGAGAFSAFVRYDIETDWDYAYLTVDGSPVVTNLSTETDPNSQNFGHGITGSSDGEWVELTADLSAYAGTTVELGFRYWTDPFVDPPGFMVDDISLDGVSLGGAEGDDGWTLDGFQTTTGSETETFFNAYLLENRQYLGYDDTLRTGPYHFGFWPEPLPDWAEHFAYRRGMVVTYWNTQYEENNVGDHPGGGLALPVDAHPRIDHWPGGDLAWGGITSYDAAFGTWPIPELELHRYGAPVTFPAKPPVSRFDDTRSWWFNCDRHGCTGDHPGFHQPGWYSVDVPPTGTTVNVTGRYAGGTVLGIRVN